MKVITTIILLISSADLFAQTDSVNGKMPIYNIHLTTVNDNKIKGLLLHSGDSSVNIYPAERKNWRANELFNPVSFDYTRIKQISIKKKNGTLKGIVWGGAIGITIFCASALLHTGKAKGEVFKYTFPAIPLGIIAGAIIGNRAWKKFNINSNLNLYNSFKNKIQ